MANSLNSFDPSALCLKSFVYICVFYKERLYNTGLVIGSQRYKLAVSNISYDTNDSCVEI